MATIMSQDKTQEERTRGLGGTETVLIVEDNDLVREMVAAIVGDLGYRTLAARDASEALSIIENGPTIDLLFTDVNVPGSPTIPDLVRIARERLPGLVVLYTSGYTQDILIQQDRLNERVELLSKPYGSDALARKFRDMLDRRPGFPGKKDD